MAPKSSKTSKQAETVESTVAFDSELDAFFKAAPAVATPAVTVSQPSASKPAPSLKRKAAEPEPTAEESEDEEDSLSEGSGVEFSDSEDDEPVPSTSAPRVATADGYVPPVHEAVASKGKATVKSAKINHKFVEVDEPRLLKDKRTLFIGNLPMDIVKSRPMQKRLIRLIESLSPYRAVTMASNLRFRSIAFSVPTASTELDETPESLQKRARKMERSQVYKEAMAAVEGGSAVPQKPLTAPQKRKIAYINQNLNEKAGTVSAYLTIAHPKALVQHLYAIAPPKATTADVNVASQARLDIDDRLTGPVLTAFIAAYADGQQFEDRHLRVDVVSPLDSSEIAAAGIGGITTADGFKLGSTASATKQTVFVGGLDFEANEEDVRAFFEKLIVEERGSAEAVTVDVMGLDSKPPATELLTEFTKAFPWLAAEKHEHDATIVRPGKWVRSVRIVRDKATQLGKGIAYVRFSDQQCVDEIIAISQTEEATLQAGRQSGLKGSLAASSSIAAGGKEFKRRLKLRGRPVRVSRCKAQTKSSSVGKEPPSTPQRAKYDRSTGAPTPNGTSPHSVRMDVVPPSPLSAKQIADKADQYSKLSKDERIQMKKQDNDRVQRRLAKKAKKSKSTDSGNDKSLAIEGEKAKRKERVKLKQPTGAPGAKSANGKGKGKPKSSSFPSSKPSFKKGPKPGPRK